MYIFEVLLIGVNEKSKNNNLTFIVETNHIFKIPLNI